MPKIRLPSVSIKAVTLTIATALSLAGLLGPFLVLDPLQARVSRAAAEINAAETTASKLRLLQSEYSQAFLGSNVLFAMNTDNVKASTPVAAQLYQLSLYSRATPCRAIIAELVSLAGLNFAETNGAYDKLQDAARKDFSYQNYIAVFKFEQDITDKAFKSQNALIDRRFAAEDEKAVAETALGLRRALLVFMTAAGTIVLLIANLLAEPAGAKKRAPV